MVLPDKINPPLATCDTGCEIHKLAIEYNKLPVGDPRREEIYKQIEDKNFYIRYFD